ncbi:Ig-like domain-containing protein, partial [bacterium]|nr:Ig-like domain-containing protein [bacterium]
MSRQAKIAAIVGLFLVVNIVGLIEIRRAVTRRSHVTIESIEPEGRVNPYASVSIRFSEPMVLATALGKDVETDLVAFEPGLKGVFRWKNPRTLCFFPEKPLPMATAYVGTVDEEITSLAGHTLADDAVFSFHTPPLELERVTQTNFSRNAESTLALEFNDKVSPEQVAGHLTLRSPDDKKVKFDLQGKATSRRVVVRTHPYHPRRIVVTLSPGLKGQSGPLGMDDEVRRVVDLDSALVIRRVDGLAPGPGRIHISVRCSQRIDTDSAQQHLDVKPAVKFTVENNWSGFTVHGDFSPGTRYELVFRKGMKAVNGAALTTDVTRT